MSGKLPGRGKQWVDKDNSVQEYKRNSRSGHLECLGFRVRVLVENLRLSTETSTSVSRHPHACTYSSYRLYPKFMTIPLQPPQH